MRVTISVPNHIAYGEDEAIPATPGAPSEQVAISNLVHNFPGGVAALAKRAGMSANTLQHKANLNNDTHHLSVAELAKLQHITGDMSVTQALAAAQGYVCTRILPAAPTSVVDGLTRVMSALASFAEAVRDATEDGKPVTRAQERRVDYFLGELLGNANALSALVRACAATPKDEA